MRFKLLAHILENPHRITGIILSAKLLQLFFAKLYSQKSLDLTFHGQAQHHLMAQKSGIYPHIPLVDLQLDEQIALLGIGVI